MISQATDRDDISELGRKVYCEQIEPKLSSDDHGRFVVIDVDSGDYEIANHDIDATLELMKRREPGRFYGVRVGYKAAYRLGTRTIGWAS